MENLLFSLLIQEIKFRSTFKIFFICIKKIKVMSSDRFVKVAIHISLGILQSAAFWGGHITTGVNDMNTYTNKWL